MSTYKRNPSHLLITHQSIFMNKPLKTGWYVLYVKSCQEKKVETLLQENKINAYVPLVKTIRKWSDRKKVIMKPLFSSYVFVNIKSKRDFHTAIDTNGACAYIRFGSEYAIVSDNEIKRIKFILESDDIKDIENNSKLIRVGEIRTIQEGALCGLDCEIVKINNKNKIIVRISSIQQNILATLPEYYLSDLPLAI